MAIKFQYGGGAAGSAAGQIIAQAGQGNLNREAQERQAAAARAEQSQRLAAQIDASRESQMRAIDAQADRDRQSANQATMRAALDAGLGREMQEREYELRLEEARGKAEAKAKETKLEYSAESKRELSKINAGRGALTRAFSAGRFSREELDRGMQELDMTEAGIEPSRRSTLGDPPPLAEQAVTLPDGTVVFPGGAMSIATRSDQSPEARKMKYDQEFKMAELKIRQEQEAEMRDFEDSLWRERVKDPATGRESSLGKAKIDATMRERYGSRFELSDEEQRAAVQSELQEKYPSQDYASRDLPPTPPQPQVPQDPEAEARAAAATADSGQWWDAVQQQGVQVPGEYKELPAPVGTAKSIYDAYIEKFGSFENIPEKYQPAVAELILTIGEYEKGRN